MKKITFLIVMFFSSFLAMSQVCEQTFSITGPDTSSVLTVTSDQLNCYSGTLNSITIASATLGSSAYCRNWYEFDIDIDGVVTTDVCAADLANMVVTDFTTITITSSDADVYTDQITISITFAVNFNTATAPNCDAELTTPVPGDSEASLTGNLVWTPATGGVGNYLLKVGTTPGGSDVADVELAYNVTSYDIPGTLPQGVQYYVSIIPVNANGAATGCTEYSFTTVVLDPGNICEDAIVIGELPFSATDDTTNYLATFYAGSPGASGCGSTSSYLGGNDVIYSYTSTYTGTAKVNLTGALAYTGIFVYTSCANIGVSCVNGKVNGYEGGAILIEELAVETGVTYYFVISTWPSPQTTPFTLEISENTCTNGTATYSVVSACDQGEQFMVNVNVTSLGSATSMTISDDQGSTPVTITEIGTTTFGPYENATPVIFTTYNDQDQACFLTSPAITQTVCPPANDNCSGAEELTVNEAYVCDSFITTTLNGATGSVVTGDTCYGNPNDDIWYSFVATGSMHRISLTNTSSYVDLYHSLWTGDCDGALTLVPNSCSDGDVSNPSGLVAGQVYFLRIYSYGAANSTVTFNVCIGTPPPPPANDTCATAIDLTNETSPIQGNTEGATNTNLTVCNYNNELVTNLNSDVYYSILVPNGSTLYIGQTAVSYDSANVVFYGDCDNRTSIACFDDPNLTEVEWANNTGADQTVYWVQDGWSGSGTFTLAWSVIACTPAEGTVKVVSNCEAGEEFMVEVEITNLGSATSLTISDDQGSAPQTITAVGIVTFGPYPNGEGVIMTVANDQDDNCTLTSSELTQTDCPPTNDECLGATAVVVDEQFCNGTDNNGTNLGATDSGVEAAECFNSGMNDVWFSFVVPEGTATVDISTDFLGGTLLDSEIALYSGSCDALVEEDCDQDSGVVNLSNGYSWNSVITDAPVNVGETYYVRVSGYSSSAAGSFCLDVSTNQTLSSSEFTAAGFTAYPNPVKDVLNLSYTQNISNVEVFNMLGQQVLTQSVGANKGQVDMSNLATGTYLVKVATDNQVKTLKVVKQ